MTDATRVAIIGLGAIGGSAALKLIERGVVPTGFAASETDRRLAVSAGVQVADSIEGAVAESDLVLIAVPLDAVAAVARRVIAAAPTTTTVLHAASLQRASAVAVDPAMGQRVIGTHPLAGTSSAGFEAARSDLYRRAVVFVEPRGTPRNREDAELFWSMAGAARVEYLDADEHDDRMAAISHLPQLVSTALAAAFAKSGVAPDTLGPGGRDMTRLAESSWSMWAPLLAATPKRTTALLAGMTAELNAMRGALEMSEIGSIAETWKTASQWREGA